MFKEERKFPRANVKFKIKVICEGTVILGEPQNYTFHTYTESIGEGGVKVILEKELKIASLVKLELFITSKKTFPIKCKGIVVWTQRVNPEGTSPDLFETGIQFIELDKNDQEVIGNIATTFK
ncbi:PilZ domain-containing protein [bacterium]|nr:MAG: PilZ domain-containing protein [bacterium]